jgi:hypothetical protein
MYGNWVAVLPILGYVNLCRAPDWHMLQSTVAAIDEVIGDLTCFDPVSRMSALRATRECSPCDATCVIVGPANDHPNVTSGSSTIPSRQGVVFSGELVLVKVGGQLSSH